MLKGRLGLETARVPHVDRHGAIYLENGKIFVKDGNLTFATVGTSHLKQGAYQIPYQIVSNILVGPGTTVSHDAFRILARNGTGLLITGGGGVRSYASMPFGPDLSNLARRQVELWADRNSRLGVARKMYSMRLGEDLKEKDISVLRGIEGIRMKEVYKQLARHYGIQWKGRRYDRHNPQGDDIINAAINHAATAVYAASNIAVACTTTIPQLGFIHEKAGVAFSLDIADLFRVEFTLPAAFESVKMKDQNPAEDIERITRRLVGIRLGQKKTIPCMIDAIKEVLGADDGCNDAQSS